MARKNRFGTFMNINILYWIIGLVVIYFLFIRDISYNVAPGPVKVFDANSKKKDKPK
jgi:hypothetical protein